MSFPIQWKGVWYSAVDVNLCPDSGNDADAVLECGYTKRLWLSAWIILFFSVAKEVLEGEFCTAGPSLCPRRSWYEIEKFWVVIFRKIPILLLLLLYPYFWHSLLPMSTCACISLFLTPFFKLIHQPVEERISPHSVVRTESWHCKFQPCWPWPFQPCARLVLKLVVEHLTPLAAWLVSHTTNANSSLPAQVPTANVPWVIFLQTTGPSTLSPPCWQISPAYAMRKTHLSPHFFLFPPSGFPGWENATLPMVLAWPNHLSRLTVAKGRGGNGLEEQEIPAWWASLPCAQGTGSSLATLWFRLLWGEEGHFWELKDGIQN